MKLTTVIIDAYEELLKTDSDKVFETILNSTYFDKWKTTHKSSNPEYNDQDYDNFKKVVAGSGELWED